jgi:2,4-dienoyl-CoA reductase-like NADH-dependent reductase (Old Yellow Enzyme family)
MAPLTRNRASISLAPTDIMTKYYTQRASAGEHCRIVSAENIGDNVAGSCFLCCVELYTTLRHTAVYSRSPPMHLWLLLLCAANAGLIIAEATQVNKSGQGYPLTPGIFTQEQIEGWRKVTDSVHAAGGHIFLQLWHCGRVSHSSYHGGKLPISASPVKITVGQVATMVSEAYSTCALRLLV